MSEDQDKNQERTEQATPKKREEARKKGQVAKSQEMTSVAILLACLTLFYFTAAVMIEKMVALMRWIFMKSGTFGVNSENIYPFMLTLVNKVFGLLFPLLLTVVCIALAANFAQVGFLLSGEAIRPKLSKINPINGFKRLFSVRSLVELVKSIFKIIIVGFVAYLTIKGEMTGLIPLGDQSTGGILVYLGTVSFKVIFRTCWVLVILAILDYGFQRWEYEKNLKMSKQEIKDEHKQTEGDPLIKARIRRVQREAARKRMMANIPKADVIITNPTHLAIAVQYEQGSMEAPRVIAKGSGYIAEKIREIARKNNIPLVENKPLARVLYKIVKIDETIPPNLYRAVAEVLAYVYDIKRKKMGRY